MPSPGYQFLRSFPKNPFCNLDYAYASSSRSIGLGKFPRFSVKADDGTARSPNGDVDPPIRRYKVVVAATRNMGIGKDGKLPWRLPSDLKFFKDLTTTTSDSSKRNAMVMGRKTWESIPISFRPLPARLNVVLTRSGSIDDIIPGNVVKCGSLSSALELLALSPYSESMEKVFVIGGGQVLREAMNAPLCDAIHITEIETDIECDTFIPPIDLSVFQPCYSSPPLVENDIRFSFVTYARRDSISAGKLETFLPKMILEKHQKLCE